MKYESTTTTPGHSETCVPPLLEVRLTINMAHFIYNKKKCEELLKMFL